jgi:hypothetical protein
MIGQILNLDHYYRFKFSFSIYQLKLIKQNVPRYRDFLTLHSQVSCSTIPIHNLARRSGGDDQYAPNSY